MGHSDSPDVFESAIAWDRSNDCGEWFGTLEVYDHEIRWGGSDWSSEDELRSKYDIDAGYSNLPDAYTTGAEWNSGENRAELEVVAGSSGGIQDKTYYYADFWMDTLGSTTKTVEVFIKSELGALPGFPNPLDPRAQDYRFIGVDCFVPPPSGGYKDITIFPPTTGTPSCGNSLSTDADKSLAAVSMSKADRFNVSEYVKKKKAELERASRKAPMREAYTLITFRRPIPYDLAMKTAEETKIEVLDIKYTNSYGFVKFEGQQKTEDKLSRLTERINRRHEKLGIASAKLKGIIAVRGYGRLAELKRISGNENAILADFSTQGKSLPFIYYEFQRKRQQ